MKRTCYKCKALNRNYCDLGYKVKSIWKYNKETEFYLKVVIPEEGCPKPLNFRYYNRLIQEFERKKNEKIL